MFREKTPIEMLKKIETMKKTKTFMLRKDVSTVF